jgi:hypothetical protein
VTAMLRERQVTNVGSAAKDKTLKKRIRNMLNGKKENEAGGRFTRADRSSFNSDDRFANALMQPALSTWSYIARLSVGFSTVGHSTVGRLLARLAARLSADSTPTVWTRRIPTFLLAADCPMRRLTNCLQLGAGPTEHAAGVPSIAT